MRFVEKWIFGNGSGAYLEEDCTDQDNAPPWVDTNSSVLTVSSWVIMVQDSAGQLDIGEKAWSPQRVIVLETSQQQKIL